LSLTFFTSVASNYLPKAAVLGASLRKHSPGSPFYVVLNDTPPADLKRFSGLFDRVFLPGDWQLPVANFEQWVFQHTLVELCTAVKGPFLLYAFEQLKAAKMVYLDPDIVVLDSLHELDALLDVHSIVATPHLLEPENSRTAIEENEVCALRHGAFNLGFVAVRNDSEGLRFARWWCERLIEFCYDDILNGLFTDQRWMDLAPGFFPGFHILRDRTYNVATWNLSNRHVEKEEGGKLCIDGSPIKFFHFSGFDSGSELAMLRKYGQHSPALFELREKYTADLDRAGQSQFGRLPWGYGFFSNGQPIQNEYRSLYRQRSDLMRDFPQPARVEHGRKSYYQWCEKNFEDGRIPSSKLPLLEKWKRSVRKRVGLLRQP
jgi:hypothetical protein